MIGTMKRTGWICLLLLLRVLSAQAQESVKEEASTSYFRGGGSEIEGNDSRRAAKAIRKWSDPGAWVEEGDATAAPYFWDYSKVGRKVFIRILKRGNREGSLEVWLRGADSEKFERFKSYHIAYFSGGPGPKTKRGDYQAPEGFYFISRRAMNPLSFFHLSMDVGYPNAFDRFHGRTGDYLMIHGNAVSTGCYAMTDASIEQIYTLVDAALKNGQRFVRVHCFPFEMTDENLKKHTDSEHYSFWENLKDGWDWFEEKRVPPNVTVVNGTYRFAEAAD